MRAPTSCAPSWLNCEPIHRPAAHEDFIDYLLTGSQPFIGFLCSSKEEAIVKAYRENAAFAQWLNDGMERFT